MIYRFEKLTIGFEMAANKTFTDKPREMNKMFIKSIEYLENMSTERVYVPIIFGLFVFIGVAGNSLVIYSITSNKRMRTLTNILILNLAIGDLAFLVMCVPCATFRFIATYWPFGDIGCKFFHYFTNVSLYVSIYTLVLMAISRYCAIVHPLSSIRIRTKRNFVLAVVILWMSCLIGHIPGMIQMKVYRYTTISDEASMCQNSYHLTNPVEMRIYYVLFTVFGFIFPLVMISILYVLILRSICATKHPSVYTNTPNEARVKRRRGRRHAATMILVVIATFAVCWLPAQIFMLIHAFDVWKTESFVGTDMYINLLLAAKCLAYSNSCLNPILYTFLSSNFRNSFRETLCCRTTRYQRPSNA